VSDENINMSKKELEVLMAQAVLESKVEDIEETIPRIFDSLKSLESKFSNIPLEIYNCRDEMDSKMKAYNHEQFITENELNMFENKLESMVTHEVGSLRHVIVKAKWIITGFLFAATFINYLISNTNIFNSTN